MIDSASYLWIFVFVVVSYGLLHIIKLGLSQWLKWDVGERERVLQQKLIELQYELDKAKGKVGTLERQIEIVVQQYEDAIARLAAIKTQYEEAVVDAKSLRQELAAVQREIPKHGATDTSRRTILIAAVGTKDSGLELDLASLRAVKMETGLEFERITEATPEKLKIALDRARMNQSHTYLHLSVHSDARGYLLGEKIVDATWLSGVLEGVIILVVAGCESDYVGDFLGVVPYVVTMSEKVTSRDAAQFSRAFWTEIGKGIGASLAIQRALQRAPSGMSEYVVKHWSY